MNLRYRLHLARRPTVGHVQPQGVQLLDRLAGQTLNCGVGALPGVIEVQEGMMTS
jgi:hypothetical protein